MSAPRGESVLVGAFKGMGDLMSAAPVIVAELNAGIPVSLLLFPSVKTIVDLLDWGENSHNLNVLIVPAKKDVKRIWPFLMRMARLTPSLVWVSPHAPLASRSWRVPLFLWLFKTWFWRGAKLAGARSERFSSMFDILVPADRSLPLATREWSAYAMLGRYGTGGPPQIKFRQSLQRNRTENPLYDILIHPGANAGNRKWPVQHFVALIEMLPTRVRVGLVGLAEDIEPIRSSLRDTSRVQCIVGSLEDAIAAIARTRVLLSMDSGTTFFSKALRVPTVALYGPVDPASVIPGGGEIEPVYERRWSCQPCGDAHCRYSINHCMQAIEPNRVARELLQLLRKVDNKRHDWIHEEQAFSD